MGDRCYFLEIVFIIYLVSHGFTFQVLSRRTITSEDTVSAVLSNITGKCRSGLSTDELSAIENRDMKESECQ